MFRRLAAALAAVVAFGGIAHAQPTSGFPAATGGSASDLYLCSQAVAGEGGHYVSHKCTAPQVGQGLNGSLPTQPFADGSQFLATDAYADRGLAAKRPDFPYPPLNLPIHFAQMLGPTTLGAQQELTGQVDWMFESNFSPQPGVNSMFDVGAYRMELTPPGWTGTNLAWLYANHPDWIVYNADGVTPSYSYNSSAYPPWDITNPAALAYFLGTYVTDAAGYQGVHFDNLSMVNNTGEVGVYVNPTLIPCPTQSQPACDGTWMPKFSGANGVGLDTAWTAATFNLLKTARQTFNTAGLELWGNCNYADPLNVVAGCNLMNGTFLQELGMHGASNPTLAGYDQNSFEVDGYFTDEEFIAANVSNNGLIDESALSGHDTSAITYPEQEYCLSFALMVFTDFPRDFLFCGADISASIEAYPPLMGGKSYVTGATLTTTANSTAATLSSTAGVGQGMAISAANLPPGTFVQAVSSNGSSITLTQAATSTANTETSTISGWGPVAVGTPTSPPPQVTMGTNGISTAAQCGLSGIGDRAPSGYSAATDNGLCVRYFTKGWVVINPVCEAVQYTLSTGATSAGAIIPAAATYELDLPSAFNGATAVVTYTPPSGSPTSNSYTSAPVTYPNIAVVAGGTVSIAWTGGTPTGTSQNPLVTNTTPATTTLQGPCTAAAKSFTTPAAPGGGSGNWYDMSGSHSVVASGGVITPGSAISVAGGTAVAGAYGSSGAIPWVPN